MEYMRVCVQASASSLSSDKQAFCHITSPLFQAEYRPETWIGVTFRVCYVYIVLFLALLSFGVVFCSTSRSVFIG